MGDKVDKKRHGEKLLIVKTKIKEGTFSGIVNTYRSITLMQFSIAIVFSSILAIVLTQTEIAHALQRGETLAAWKPWFWIFSAVYCYMAMCPIISYFCHQWALERDEIIATLLKLVVLYLPFTLIFITVMILVRQIGQYAIEGVLKDYGTWLDRYLYELPKTMPMYLAVVFASYAKIYYKTVEQEQLKAAKLNEELAIAKMDVLRNQLNPHFLFNTLNLISGTMYVNVDKADSIITRLGDLLRYSLATERKPWIKLEEEMTVMLSFLEIAKLRFGDKMLLDIQISEDAKVVQIPAMLLQPLLENAIKYGVEPSDTEAQISLLINVNQEKLHIRLTNPFHQNASTKTSFGIGLNNTRKRLNVLYGDESELILEEPKNGTITLSLLLPVNYNKDAFYT
jgi:hypothetical protein